MLFCFFFSSRRRHTRLQGDWSSDVCSSDLGYPAGDGQRVRWRTVFRADGLHRMTAGTDRRVSALGWRTVVDLQIGRASCRERGWSTAGAESVKEKENDLRRHVKSVQGVSGE